MYDNKLTLVYKNNMRLQNDVGYSKSPNKPHLFNSFLHSLSDFNQNFKIFENWEPFEKEEFYLAHTKNYVNCFFHGASPQCNSNNLEWSPELANNVRYTNASLYHAMERSFLYPEEITLSPTSGFHHATPEGGSGYCTFSGQVLASLKLYDKYKISGAYIDLDQHFGNSIEDSRQFCPDLDKAIPIRANVNPKGIHGRYILDLEKKLEYLRPKFNSGELSYLVACSGADSLVDDDLGGSCNLEEWLKCKEIVYEFAKSLNVKIPLTITLFGGYRSDDYNSVLDAHYLDLMKCFKILLGVDLYYNSIYKKKI